MEVLCFCVVAGVKGGKEVLNYGSTKQKLREVAKKEIRTMFNNGKMRLNRASVHKSLRVSSVLGNGSSSIGISDGLNLF